MVAAVNRRWQLARRELHVFAPFDHDDVLRGNCKILNHLLPHVLVAFGLRMLQDTTIRFSNTGEF
jgi:hypothetical protein